MTQPGEGFPQSQFGRDLGASVMYVTTVYERIALLYRHVASVLAKQGWTEWPRKAKMTETSASLDWPRWWLLTFAVKAFVMGGAETPDAEKPTRVLAIGVQLTGDEEPFEPLAHGLAFHFDRHLARDDWDTSWFRDTILLGPKELEVQAVWSARFLLRRFQPKKDSQGWNPLRAVESFCFPLTRLDSDDDVQNLLIDPLMVLARSGFEGLK